MKRTSLILSLTTGLLLAFGAGRLMASDASSETTLSGTMVCAKCKLHQADKCQNVLQVEKDGKTVNYYLTENKVSKDFHSNICQNDGEKVTVTGKVKEKGGKEIMSASKIEAAK
jgi:hypothetical protein